MASSWAHFLWRGTIWLSPPAWSSSHDAPKAKKLSTKLDQHRLYRRTDTQFPESLAANFFVSPGSLAARKVNTDSASRLARVAATETMPFPKESGLDIVSDPAALKIRDDTTSFSGGPGKSCFSYAFRALVKAAAQRSLVPKGSTPIANSHR